MDQKELSPVDFFEDTFDAFLPVPLKTVKKYFEWLKRREHNISGAWTQLKSYARRHQIHPLELINHLGKYEKGLAGHRNFSDKLAQHYKKFTQVAKRAVPDAVVFQPVSQVQPKRTRVYADQEAKTLDLVTEHKESVPAIRTLPVLEAMAPRRRGYRGRARRVLRRFRPRYARPSYRTRTRYSRYRRGRGRFSGFRRRKAFRRGGRRRVKNLTSNITSESASLNCDVNSVNYVSIPLLNSTQLEDMASNVRQIGVDNLGTTTRVETLNLLGIDATKILVNNASMRIEIRNNEVAPVKIDMWYCYSKQFTTTSPTNWWSNDMADLGQASVLTNPLFKFGYGRLLRKYYMVRKIGSITVQTGDEHVVSCAATKAKVYAPDDIDHSGSTIIPGFTRFIVLRIRGVVAHDAIMEESEIGLSGAQIDYIVERKFAYKGLHTTHSIVRATSGYDAFSNNAEIAQDDMDLEVDAENF